MMQFGSFDFWFWVCGLLFATILLSVYKWGECVGRNQAHDEWITILRNAKGETLAKPMK